MGKNNFPQSAVDKIEPDAVQSIVTSLKELHDKGKPQTDEEIKQRIDDYFSFCQQSSIRPGIESLCLSLHITRTTLFNWSNGINCSKECQEIVQTAKGFISAFLEQATLQGRLNPASSCFLFKNWCGYRDSVSFELDDTTKQPQALKASELPVLGTITPRKQADLPYLGSSIEE